MEFISSSLIDLRLKYYVSRHQVYGQLNIEKYVQEFWELLIQSCPLSQPIYSKGGKENEEVAWLPLIGLSESRHLRKAVGPVKNPFQIKSVFLHS